MDFRKMNLLPNVTLPEMQKVIDHFDVFNVTKLDIFNMTALDIFNVSKLDIFNMTKLDIFNVTNFDLFNATKQTLMDNPILDQLKTLAKESLNRNSTRFSSKEDVDASDLKVKLRKLQQIRRKPTTIIRRKPLTSIRRKPLTKIRRKPITNKVVLSSNPLP